jgi:hypothetical protein
MLARFIDGSATLRSELIAMHWLWGKLDDDQAEWLLFLYGCKPHSVEWWGERVFDACLITNDMGRYQE